MDNIARVGSRGGALLMLMTASADVFAQAPRVTLFGTVRDTSGTPVALARLSSSGLLALTDTAGRFAFAGLPSGAATVAVRRLGFEPRDTSFDLVLGRTDSLHFVLTVLPRDLPGVTADARGDVRLSEFYRHRRSSEGHFFDRQEIEERRVTRISELLRRVPGIRLSTDRIGRSQVRIGRTSGGRDCPPDFWIDGMRVPYLQVDDVPLVDVEALEIYHGPAGLPPEYNARMGNPGCGTIVIWTRTPG
jgi:hypothetical protein